jgi:hypothetical protein
MKRVAIFAGAAGREPITASESPNMIWFGHRGI